MSNTLTTAEALSKFREQLSEAQIPIDIIDDLTLTLGREIVQNEGVSL